MFPCARFDDHTAASERAFALRGLQETVVARRIDEVIPALERAERATADGMWAGGFIAYEAAPAFDPSLAVRLRELTDPFSHLPLVWFGLFDRRETYPPFEPRSIHPAPYNVSMWRPELLPNDYASAVRAIKDEIDVGAVDQMTFSLRLRSAFSGLPEEFYRDLVLAQRAAHSAYFDLGRYRLVSASPQMFFRVDGDRITTRPMKGTVRRGRWLAEDRELARRLSGSEADRDEIGLIVGAVVEDLEKITEPGSIEHGEGLELERFETVWQLSSHLTGRLTSPELSIVEVLRAMFPAIPVAGVPRKPAMDLIARYEASPRGVYCGAVGFMAPADAAAPRAMFNVAIRTVTIDIEEGVAEYGAGSGILASSSPDVEYEEARLKAQLLVERRPDFELVESIRWDPLQGFWWLGEHLDRLGASADFFGFRFDRSSAELRLARAVDGLDGARRVTLALRREGSMRVDVSDQVLEPIADQPGDREARLQLVLDEEPVSTGDVFLFHSTTHQRAYGDRTQRHPEADDVLLCNERGEITCGTTGNVAVRFGEEWWTPVVDSGCRPGIMRRALLDKGAIKERVIACHELRAADEIAVFDSVTGWRTASLRPLT